MGGVIHSATRRNSIGLSFLQPREGVESPRLGIRSPHLPTGYVLSLGLARSPPRGPKRGGAASDTLTPLRCPPPGGERPTRVSPAENLGHAHPRPKRQGMGRGLNDRHAHLPGWPLPHACFPGGSLCLLPSGSPSSRPRWDSCLVHSAACWSWDISQQP